MTSEPIFRLLSANFEAPDEPARVRAASTPVKTLPVLEFIAKTPLLPRLPPRLPPQRVYTGSSQLSSQPDEPTLVQPVRHLLRAKQWRRLRIDSLSNGRARNVSKSNESSHGRRPMSSDAPKIVIRRRRSSDNGRLEVILSQNDSAVCHLNSLGQSLCKLNITTVEHTAWPPHATAPIPLLPASCKRKVSPRGLVLELISDSDDEIEPGGVPVRATMRAGGHALNVSFRDRQCERSWRKLFGSELNCVITSTH